MTRIARVNERSLAFLSSPLGLGGTNSPGSSLPWFIVTDHGAVGDGTTDDTTDFNSTIAALNAAGGGVLYIPAGVYKITSSLTTITVPCLVLGDGRYTSASGPISEIDCTSTTASLFTVSANGCTFRDLFLNNTSGGTQTAGAAITTTGGILATFEGLTILEFFTGIDIENSISWALRNCYISEVWKYGVRVRNTALPDNGDWIIESLWCSTTNNGDAAVRIESSGGGKISGLKVNSGDVANSFDHGIDCTVGTGVDTSVLLIANCSIENIQGDGIRVVTTGTGKYDLVSIVGVQFGLYTNTTGHAIRLQAATIGDISGVVLDDLICRASGGNTGSAVSLTRIEQVRIGQIVNDGFGIAWDEAACTGIVDAGGMGRVHHVYPTGYTPSGQVSGGNLGINGGTVAQQIVVPAPLYLDTLRYKNHDTATARSIEFGLFRDDGSANAMCVAKGSDSFTPGGAASNRTPAFTSAPIFIPPGVYWIVVRNTGGATNFQFSFLVANATVNIGLVQLESKTLAGALPAVTATLDLSASWTRTSLNSLACALIGRVFGEGSAF